MHHATRFGTIVLIGLALLMLPSLGMASITFTASNTLGVNVFQQTLNNPCVIGDQSCKEPAGMTYEAVSGTPGGNNGSSYDLYSPTYTATSPFSTYSGNLIPTSFTIGVDENIAAGAGAEVLLAFNTYVCTSTVASGGNISTSGSIPAGCTKDTANSYTGPTTIPNENNGNGFSDFILTGFSLTAGQKYLFEAKVSSDTDGMEEFFLIPSGSPAFVPEPASIFMLGTTLIGVGALVRRRRQTKA